MKISQINKFIPIRPMKALNKLFAPNLAPLAQDTISFSGRRRNLQSEMKNLPKDAFLSDGLRDFMLQNLSESDNDGDLSVAELHKAYYLELFNCKTLNEAKELYPEFENVVDASEIDLSTLPPANSIVKIANGKIEGASLDNLSLDLLQKYIGALTSLSAPMRPFYYNLATATVRRLLDDLNIKFDERYNELMQAQKRADTMDARWQDADYRQKMSNSTKRLWQNEDHRQRMSDSTHRLWQNPEHRAKMEAMWHDLDFIKSQHDAAVLQWSDPELRAQKSERTKLQMQDPEMRKRLSDSTSALWQDEDYRRRQELHRKDPQFREQVSEKLRQNWKKEGYRENMSAKIHELWQTFEYKKKMEAVANNDEIQRKRREAIKAVRQTDKSRAKSSNAAKKQWQNAEYREAVTSATIELWKNPNHRELMKVVNKAAQAAWDIHPTARSSYKKVAKDFPLIGEIYNKLKAGVPLTNVELAYRAKFFKVCHEEYPSVSQEIGDIQKAILGIWGFYEEDRELDKLKEAMEADIDLAAIFND